MNLQLISRSELARAGWLEVDFYSSALVVQFDCCQS